MLRLWNLGVVCRSEFGLTWVGRNAAVFLFEDISKRHSRTGARQANTETPTSIVLALFAAQRVLGSYDGVPSVEIRTSLILSSRIVSPGLAAKRLASPSASLPMSTEYN